MSKLIFEYAVMNSGKTAKLLQMNYDYNRIGKKVFVMKPSIDTRDINIIRSRNGLETRCHSFHHSENLRDVILSQNEKYNVVLIDEAQFLKESQVEDLRQIVNEKNIIVICFGLKSDFMGKLFEGSKRLLELSDTINENNTFCHCGEKATMNMKYNSQTGEAIKHGVQIDCGAEDKYTSVCSKHWYEGNIGK